MKKEGHAGRRRKGHNQKVEDILDWRNQTNRQTERKMQVEEGEKGLKGCRKGRKQNKNQWKLFAFLFNAIFILHAAFKNPAWWVRAKVLTVTYHLFFSHLCWDLAFALCSTYWCLSRKFTLSWHYGILLRFKKLYKAYIVGSSADSESTSTQICVLQRIDNTAVANKHYQVCCSEGNSHCAKLFPGWVIKQHKQHTGVW